MGERARARAKTKFYCMWRTRAKFYCKGERPDQVRQMGTRARFYIMGEITRAKFYNMGTRAKFYIMGEITRAKFYGMGKGLVQGQVLL